VKGVVIPRFGGVRKAFLVREGPLEIHFLANFKVCEGAADGDDAPLGVYRYSRWNPVTGPNGKVKFSANNPLAVFPPERC